VSDERNKLVTYKSGKQQCLSGRDLFTFNPDFNENDNPELNDGDVVQYKDEMDEQTEQDKVFEINDYTFCALDAKGDRIVEMDDDNLYDNDGNIIVGLESRNGYDGAERMDRFVFDKELFTNIDDLPCSDSDEEEYTTKNEDLATEGSSEKNPNCTISQMDIERLGHELGKKVNAD